MSIETQSVLGQSFTTAYGPAASSYGLRELFEYRNHDKMALYLRMYPELTSFLEESRYYLTKHFGVAAKFTLEVVRDPEAQQQQLMVYINTALPVDQALQRLEKLDDEWFLDHTNHLGHLINFNLEVI